MTNEKTIFSFNSQPNFVAAYGQYAVKGKIMDPEDVVMPMVNVAFLNQADSTLVSGAVSDSCGIYSTSLAEGNYIIRYSYLGYKTLYKKMQVNTDCTLPEVRMEASQTTLKEVEGTAFGSHSNWTVTGCWPMWRIPFLLNKLI